MRRRDFLAGSAVGAVGLLAVRTAVSQESSNTAKQAFSFGYPLVLMDLTHRAMAGAGGPDQPAAFNRFFHYGLPTEQFTAVVCPVPDALHSSAWLNVKQEPMVVSLPALGGAFCTGSFFHAWNDVIGRIGSGNGKPAEYLVTGPGWKGAVPKGLVQIASPTNMVWAPIWISVATPAELAAAAAMQSQFRVTPLKDWKPQTPSGGGGGFSALLGSFMKGIGGPKPGMGGPAGGPPGVAVGEMPAAATGAPGAGGSTQVAAPLTVEGSATAGAAGAAPATTASSGIGTAPPAAATLGSDGVPNGAAAGTTPPAGGGTMPPPTELSADGSVGLGGGGGGASGTSPNAQLFTMDAATFYTRLCELMNDNPPLEADAAIVGKMAKLGLTPGAKIDIAAQNRANQMALLGGVRNAGQKIFGSKGGMKIVTGNRWETAINTGDYGTNYDRRAYATLMYFGASGPEEVLCPRTSKDATGKPLQAPGKYTLTFSGAQMPPVSKSWSLVAYKSPMMELGAAAGGKHVVNSGAPLVKNADGGVTIYIQKDAPAGDKEANWLPIPEGPFELMLRLCGPKPEVASLGWKPPAVTKV